MVGASTVCTNLIKLQSLLFFFSEHLKTPSLTPNSATTSTLIYNISRNNEITGPLITGYGVIRFRVPMIGKYMNTGRRRRVTISSAVPGAQYRITAWALSDGSRSATPAVEYATTGETSKTTTLVMEY